MNPPAQQNQPPTINIDGEDYYVHDLTPEVRGALALMDTAKAKIQTAQLDLAMAQAAYNEFGNQLRQHVAGIRPIRRPKPRVVTPPGPPAKKTPAHRPANSNRKTKRPKR